MKTKITEAIINALSGGLISGFGNKLIELIPDNLDETERAALEKQFMELQHQQELDFIRIATEQERMVYEDTQNARHREIASVQATGQRDWFLCGLAALLVLIFTGILGWVIVKDVSTNQVANIMIGYLGGSFSSVVAYYFGSSRGSKNKDEFLQAQVQASQPPKAVIIPE